MTDHIGDANQMVIDLDALEKLADGAGGKSWTLGGGGFVVEGDRPIADFLAQTDPEDGKSAPSLGDAFERANFVAAANPATIKNLIAELKEGRRLMKPFASAAEKLDGRWNENDWHWNDSVRSNVTVRDIRAARAFLARNGKGEGQ